jgi:hypothetical protein
VHAICSVTRSEASRSRRRPCSSTRRSAVRSSSFPVSLVSQAALVPRRPQLSQSSRSTGLTPPTAPAPVPRSWQRDEPELKHAQRGISAFFRVSKSPMLSHGTTPLDLSPYRLGTRKVDTFSTKPIAIVLQLADSNPVYHASILDECILTKSTRTGH